MSDARRRSRLSRRDLLKLAGAVSGGSLLSPMLRNMPATQPAQGEKPNVLIIVFDAWAAQNMSLYGYERETTPNLTRLAEEAIVYHSHFAGGNYTTPGTASLLTGLYPWTHRALRLLHPVSKSVETRSMFHAFPDFHRVAYTHNPVADALLFQFEDGLENHLPQEELTAHEVSPVLRLLGRDGDAANLSNMRIINRQENGGYARSLFLSQFHQDRLPERVLQRQAEFPRGAPFFNSDKFHFFLEDGIDYLGSMLGSATKPFFAYFHFLPPHQPYRTHRDFVGRFRDDPYVPIEKPVDVFGRKRDTVRSLARERTEYDEFILYVDREFGRLFEMLAAAGVLRDTWLLLTSDHGEMFERGISQHDTELLYQPVIRVPLLVFEPGRTRRLDIHTPTSATDILPTLQEITGGQAPRWGEGAVLPPFGPSDDERDVYAVQAKRNPGDRPLTEATLMLARGPYKLTRFLGYGALGPERERIELYDLSEDPEELNDLYPGRPRIGQEMLEALNQRLAVVDAPYL